MARHARRIAAIAVGMAFVLSGCGEEAPPAPTVAQAGDVLKKHIDQTLDNALGVEIKVTDPGGKDISCGDGKYKRTYAAEAQVGVGSVDSDVIATKLVGGLAMVADYRLEDAQRSITEKVAVSPEFHTRIVLYSPAKGQMAARGETDCLLP